MALRTALRNGLLTIILLSVTAAPTWGQNQATSAAEWSDLVWQSAMRRDSDALQDYLEQLPVSFAGEGEAIARLRSNIARHNANRSEAFKERAEARSKAQGEMVEHSEAGEISQALTDAVMVQTLSDDLSAALTIPEIRQVISAARARIPLAEAEGDWLQAQEMLYRLNILFEHTGEYRDVLQQVNRRVGLLAYYAPRRLHELRNKRAERLGEKPLGEFNPATLADWKDRLNDIQHTMVLSALDRAADDHIEGRGWRPLLDGALEALRLLATTKALSETFPALADKQRVDRWVAHIDRQLVKLARTRERDLGWLVCADLIDDLLVASTDTIKLPPEVLYREFGDGAMFELDQFSEIIWPNKIRRFEQSTRGSFVGVGILIRHDERREIMVVTPLEGGPAYFAGIKHEDRIVKVDSKSTAGWSLNDAVDRITGKEGTDVTLSVRREGEDELLTFDLERELIKLRSVKGWWKTGLTETGDPTWGWYIDKPGGVAYIRLTSFNEDTHGDLVRAWREINATGDPSGLILDLRHNPGGLLTSAVNVSNLFVPRGVIVTGEDRKGAKAFPDRIAKPNQATIADSGIPIVVLINQGSASASEIVAGCLQAYGAALVVGHRSYGKGSVQTVHPIIRRNQMSALLKLTTQYYRLPPSPAERQQGLRGRLVHKRPGADVWGVDPDLTVGMTPQQMEAAYELRRQADLIPKDPDQNAKAKDRPDINGLLTQGIDPQLETALLILQARALGESIEAHAEAGGQAGG